MFPAHPSLITVRHDNVASVTTHHRPRRRTAWLGSGKAGTAVAAAHRHVQLELLQFVSCHAAQLLYSIKNKFLPLTQFQSIKCCSTSKNPYENHFKLSLKGHRVYFYPTFWKFMHINFWINLFLNKERGATWLAENCVTFSLPERTMIVVYSHFVMPYRKDESGNFIFRLC